MDGFEWYILIDGTVRFLFYGSNLQICIVCVALVIDKDILELGAQNTTISSTIAFMVIFKQANRFVLK